MKKKTVNSIVFGRVIDEFNDLYNVDLREPNRQRNLVYYRYCFAYIGRTDYMLSYGEIGDAFNRDHATIIHYMRNYKYFTSINDPWLKKYMEDVMVIFQRVNIPMAEFNLTYNEAIDFLSREASRLIYKTEPNLTTVDRIMTAVKMKTLENLKEIDSRLLL